MKAWKGVETPFPRVPAPLHPWLQPFSGCILYNLEDFVYTCVYSGFKQLVQLNQFSGVEFGLRK